MTIEDRLALAEKKLEVFEDLVRGFVEQFAIYNMKLEEIQETMSADLFERTGERYEFTDHWVQ